jgi:hypothetical protein
MQSGQHSWSRRQFLVCSARLGLGRGAAGLAAFGPGRPRRAAAAAGRQVLIEDLVDPRSAAAIDGTLGAQRPFTHVGLHWHGPPEVPVELQTSHDGLAWTPWRRVYVERRPGETRRPEETFGALLGAPHHRFVRYRPEAADARIGAVTATCLNALDGPSVASAPGAAPSLLLQSRPARVSAGSADLRWHVVTREQWEADEALRFGPGGKELWPRAYVAPRMVVVHHTATANDYVDAAAEVRAIYAYHAVTQGFGDIGYNALIDRAGRIYEGRRGRDTDPSGTLQRDVLSYGVVAGHAFDYNYGSVGIALLGNFQEGEPTEPMLRSLKDLLVFEHGRHQIDPRAELDFARSSRLWRYELPALAGHRDCNNTECPGDALFTELADLREQVAERLDADSDPKSAITSAPAQRNPWLGVAAYDWRGSRPFDYVFEGFQREIGQDSVNYLIGYDGNAMPQHVITREPGAAFQLLRSGQYTLHVRPSGRPFADRRTVLADRHVVLDNADEDVEREGVWKESRTILEFYGQDYEVAEPGSEARFVWELAAPEAGRYTVQACWAAGTDRSKGARYRFGAKSDTTHQTTYADQTRNGGVWVDLGAVELDAREPCRVELGAATDGRVIADAVRLLKIEP